MSQLIQREGFSGSEIQLQTLAFQVPSVGVESASRYVGHGYDDKILAAS